MLNADSRTGKATILGSGTMGGVIAAQLANGGWSVWLLDIPSSQDSQDRNSIARECVARITNHKPPLFYLPEFASRITVGNIEDDLEVLEQSDWVIEAVLERMDVKRNLMAKIEAKVRPGTLVSSNTSGLSLHEMTEDCSAEFRSRFLGTHFLNPPRYLKLLEVVPLAQTNPDVLTDFQRFAEQVLGQRVVVARDTPGFISTRLWIFHLLNTIQTACEEGLSVEEADYLTGALLGRPNSATFRMADIVGLDIIANVAKNQYNLLPNDPMREALHLPTVMQSLLDVGSTGQKVGKGFYTREGKTILALDLKTMEYRPRSAVRMEWAETLQSLPMAQRIQTLLASDGEAGQRFLRRILNQLFDYIADIGSEIAEDPLTIDRVMEWGFSWEMGPCAMQDCLPDDKQQRTYYVGTFPNRQYQTFGTQTWNTEPDEPEFPTLVRWKAQGRTVLDSEGASLVDMGDGVACLELHTKMNTFNPEVVRFLSESLDYVENHFAAMVIGNQGANFSAGYNLNSFLEGIEAKDWSKIDVLLQEIQYTFLRLKRAAFPVVAALHGYTLGGGCECALHCHAIQAAPELYLGLPEFNVGVLPAGGGTKELLFRAMSAWDGKSDVYPLLELAFLRIIYPKNSTCAEDARQSGWLAQEAILTRNADRLLYEAKQTALALAKTGIETKARTIKVWGEQCLTPLLSYLDTQFDAGVLSEHDRTIGSKIAWVLCGGALSEPQQVSEEYLLQLERKVFLELCLEEKSVARMHHTLTTGKPLRN